MYNSFKKSRCLLSASLILMAPSLWATHSLPALSVKKGERPSVFRIPAGEALELLPEDDTLDLQPHASAAQNLAKTSAAFGAAQERHAALAAQSEHALTSDPDFGPRLENAYEQEQKSAKAVRRLREKVERARDELAEAQAYYAAAQDGLIHLHESVKKTPQSAQSAQVVSQPLKAEALEAMKEGPDMVSVDDLSASFDDVQSTVGLGAESFASTSSSPETGAQKSEITSSSTSSRAAQRLRGAVKDAQILESQETQIEELKNLVQQAHQLEIDGAVTDVNAAGEKLDALEEALALAEAEQAAAAQEILTLKASGGEELEALLQNVDDAFNEAVALGTQQILDRETVRGYQESVAQDHQRNDAERDLNQRATASFEIYVDGYLPESTS